jgi:ecotin
LEILAGKEMEIDCNHHGLNGTFETRTMNDGTSALFFSTTGSVFSTQMACLDDTKHLAFVSAQPYLTSYNSAMPITVFTPAGISVRHRVWEAGETNPFPPTPRYAHTHVLSAFPTEICNYNRFVLLLPEILDTQERKVEIIVGKTAYVDCNIHILSGVFSQRTIDGWGFDYLIFDSDGIMAATRMACLEPARPEFVAASQTKMVRYNIHMPVVVFAPVGFEVKYRIWEAPETLSR